MPVVLDAHDLERHHVVLVHDLLGVADPSIDELRDVHEALDGAG